MEGNITQHNPLSLQNFLLITGQTEINMQKRESVQITVIWLSILVLVL